MFIYLGTNQLFPEFYFFLPKGSKIGIPYLTLFMKARPTILFIINNEIPCSVINLWNKHCIIVFTSPFGNVISFLYCWQVIPYRRRAKNNKWNCIYLPCVINIHILGAAAATTRHAQDKINKRASNRDDSYSTAIAARDVAICPHSRSRGIWRLSFG